MLCYRSIKTGDYNFIVFRNIYLEFRKLNSFYPQCMFKLIVIHSIVLGTQKILIIPITCAQYFVNIYE